MGGKRNYREQLAQAQAEIIDLKFEIVSLREQAKAAATKERMKIVQEILAGKEE